MGERLRALLDDPLDPRLARAVLVLGCAVLLGFATLAVVARTAGPRVNLSAGGPSHSGSEPHLAWPALRQEADPRFARRLDRPTQDPQDHPGSAAAVRAERELASHRALQRLPYRGDGFRVALVGARGSRAVLRVSARSITASRRGWREFLRRFGDAGRAYLPTFKVIGGHHG